MDEEFKKFWQDYVDSSTPEILALNRKYYEKLIVREKERLKDAQDNIQCFKEQLEMICQMEKIKGM